MDVPKNPKAQQAWMLDLLLNHYGIRGHVVDPGNQPNTARLTIPEPQKAGRKPDARILKSNDKLYDLLAYFHRHHGLFAHGSLFTNCPIHPWFGRQDEQDASVYVDVFKIVPRNHGYVGFTCRRDCRCVYTWCPVHPSVPFADQRFDPFDLLQVLDSIAQGYRFPNRVGRLDDYRRELSAAFGIDTKRLTSQSENGTTGLGRYRGMRYPANKNQLLIEIQSTIPTNDQDLEEFVDRIIGLIWAGKEPEPYYDQTRSVDTVWFTDSSRATISQAGMAARLWLYLWIRQQQQRGGVMVDMDEFAGILGVTPRTLRRYREALERMKKLNRKKNKVGFKEEEFWTVKA